MSTELQEIEQTISDMVTAAVAAGLENDPRTQQSRTGKIGPSDIGFCRNKTALTVKEIGPTDSRDPWAMAVGTAVHNYVEGFLKTYYGDTWIIEGQQVTANLPRSGAQISGTPDLILPDFNALIDAKTVDGLKKVQAYGPPLGNLYQRHLYAMGAIDAGLLDPSKQVYVGNLYIDISRGGSGLPKAWVTMSPMDESLTDEIDSWVEDVIYAVRYQEDAPRDVAAAVCERICEFYTVCRGGLPMHDSAPLLDPDVLQDVDMYVKGRDMAKEGEQMKKEAASRLTGLNGSTGEWQVRTVNVAPQDIPGFSRRASTRLDVRRVRKS